jgi:predicted dehydrogenase
MSQTQFDSDLSSRPVSFAILGCGSRGREFSKWISNNPSDGRVVAIAEPDAERRAFVGDLHGVPGEMRFSTYEELLGRPRLADAVINTLMDRLHVGAAIKALDLKYHMFLEKPMAVTLEDCVAIEAAQRRNNRVVCVCHSMRYSAVYRKIKEMLVSGAIGKVMSIDQLEGVDPVHQSHSFVRGNWGNSSRSSFMLLAKSCHDIDIIMYLMEGQCRRVSSFGSLSHFTAANRPAGAPKRCIDGCPVESTCPYSAIKIYVKDKDWYSDHAGIRGASREKREEFIRTSDYGRCVYDMDNDVVDHQVVNFEFEDGATGTFTMTAFAPAGRQLRINGTHGYIRCDVQTRKIELHPFWGTDPKPQTIEIPADSGSHGGGDSAVMHSLVAAIRANNPRLVATPADESLRTHKVVFAAELSRREKRIVELGEMK